MESIGERLEDARKRKGVSLKEASEGTKIRTDYLSNIEQNKFDFELPGVYKRGFLKIYGRYLKLDTDKLLTDYEASRLGSARGATKRGGEALGRLDAPQAGKHREPGEEGENTGEPTEQPAFRRADAAAETSSSEDDAWEENGASMNYLRIGLIFGGGVAVVLILIGLLSAILGGGGGDAPAEPDLRETPQQAAASQGNEANQAATGGTSQGSGGESEGTSAQAGTETIRLTATGTVFLRVRQRSDDEILFDGTLSEGDAISVEKQGTVDILFTNAEHLRIEQGGRRFRPQGEGTGKTTVE